MDEFNCNGCSYVYRPKNGDPSRSISAGTAFEDLPDEWTCPECGARKLGFKKVPRSGAARSHRAEDDIGHINAEIVGWKSSTNR